MHHVRQNSQGPLVEISSDVYKKGNRILHNQFGRNKNPEFPLDHGGEWKSDVHEYWKWRINSEK